MARRAASSTAGLSCHAGGGVAGAGGGAAADEGAGGGAARAAPWRGRLTAGGDRCGC